MALDLLHHLMVRQVLPAVTTLQHPLTRALVQLVTRVQEMQGKLVLQQLVLLDLLLQLQRQVLMKSLIVHLRPLVLKLPVIQIAIVPRKECHPLNVAKNILLFVKLIF